MKLSHPSHSPWKPPKNGGSHITHRTTTTSKKERPILSLLTSEVSVSSNEQQQSV